jgi:hypothetical protein
VFNIFESYRKFSIGGRLGVFFQRLWRTFGGASWGGSFGARLRHNENKKRTTEQSDVCWASHDILI